MSNRQIYGFRSRRFLMKVSMDFLFQQNNCFLFCPCNFQGAQVKNNFDKFNLNDSDRAEIMEKLDTKLAA